MTMQYDVKVAHSSGNGQMVSGRVRLKNLIYLGNGTAGSIDLFDTTTAPVAATYTRANSTVTVTSTAHGLSTGNTVGITYSAVSGQSAVAGNYQIAVANANAFTITDVGSGTIASGNCIYTANGDWLTGYNTGTAVQPFQVIFSGEGVLAKNGIWANTTNISYQTVQYG